MGYRITATLTGETKNSYQLLLDWATSGEGNEYETVLLPKSAIIETYAIEPIIRRGEFYGHSQHEYYEEDLQNCFRAVYPIWGFIDVEISTFIANSWGLSENGYKKPVLERQSQETSKTQQKSTSADKSLKSRTTQNRIPFRSERQLQHRHTYSEDIQI